MHKLDKNNKMKAKDWQKATQLVRERQSQAAMADTSELSSFSLSELPVDQSRPPTVIHRPYVPLSTSMPVGMPSDNQKTTEAAQDESPFQQVIPNLSQQSLYPSLGAIGTTINTSVSPSIPFSRRVINDIEEHQRKALDDSVEGTTRGTNTFPVPDPEEQEQEVIAPNMGLQAGIIPAGTQEETLQPESLETQDTSVKQIHTIQDQNSNLYKPKIYGKFKSQRPKIPLTLKYKMMVQILNIMTKNTILIFQMTRHLKLHRKIVIILPLMMTSKTIQYNLPTQLPNHSCQEASEYPLQR